MGRIFVDDFDFGVVAAAGLGVAVVVMNFMMSCDLRCHLEIVPRYSIKGLGVVFPLGGAGVLSVVGLVISTSATGEVVDGAGFWQGTMPLQVLTWQDGSLSRCSLRNEPTASTRSSSWPSTAMIAPRTV